MEPSSPDARTPPPLRDGPPGRDPGGIPNYELLGFVKAGGFGDVWLARERVTGVRRVVKIVYKADAERAARDIEGVRRYQGCSHNHAHLIQILTVGETERCFYYVMEAADDAAEPRDLKVAAQESSATGGRRYSPTTLRTLMASRGRFDARAALVLVRKLVAGVVRLHEQDLAHCDLKPENVLIVEGEPKIGDVGLVGPLLETPAHSGTPLYMTPQGAADDLYALGRILYELVSGRRSGDFPRLPVELVSAPTAELSAAIGIINRACHPDAAKRLGRVEAFASALDRALRPVGAIDKLWRRRSPRIKALLASTAVVALLLALSFAVHWYHCIVPIQTSSETLDLNAITEPVEVEAAQLGDPPTYPYLAVAGRQVPQPGRYVIKLQQPVENFVLDARLRLGRPWGSIELGVAPSPARRGGVHVLLKGQPDGLGLCTQLIRVGSANPVGDPSADILGHPQPGIEYVLRLARCRDGVVLAMWPAAAFPGALILCRVDLPRAGLVAEYVTILGSSADPRGKVELSDLRVAGYSAPLRDALTDAPVPEWVTATVVPALVPPLPEPAVLPGGNLLAAPFHPYESDAWTSIGDWAWWEGAAPSERPKTIRCTPFSTLRRQQVRQDIYGGLQMLRFDRAALGDFEADVRIKLADWADPLNRQAFDPFVSESSSGAVGLALLAEEPPAAGDAWGPGLLLTLELEPNGTLDPAAKLSSVRGFDLNWHSRERCASVSAAGGRILGQAREVCPRTELFAPAGFTLTIRRRGTRLEMFTNGRPEAIVACDDPAPFGAGRIALCSARLIATFESLQVTPLPPESADEE